MNLTIEIPPSTITSSAFTSPRGPAPVKSNKSRCESCRKKLGLVNFQCKCGGTYCSEHRMSESHTCMYDYQSEYKKHLSTNLVKVVGAKIDMI
jgi:predicted nucleic acid binding AN1-type Zn finger protein